MREVVAHGGSTVVGVRIYYYFRGEACFTFIRFAFFHPRYRLAGGFMVWRTFLNLSKMTYRLVFSGSRHFVFIILFLFRILWLADLGCIGSKIQNLMRSSSSRCVKRRVSL